MWQYAVAGSMIGLGISIPFLYLMGEWDSVALSGLSAAFFDEIEKKYS